ncbi:MAG: ABC transporter ATP-binding protein [Flavobacteriaceae bacterium]
MKIKVEHLHFSFGDRKVFDDISFSIESSEVTSIIGVSGCGKSTLIKLLSGLKKADEGAVLYGDDKDDYVNFEDMAIVFQDSTLFPWKTVKENLELSSPEDINIDEISNTVGLNNALKLYPDELSGGMKQRAEFGKIIARNPKLLFMDEPFGSLDMQYRKHLQEVFLNFQNQQKPTTIIITHDIDEALKVSKYVKVLVGNPVNDVLHFKVDTSSNNTKEKIEKILYENFKNK